MSKLNLEIKSLIKKVLEEETLAFHNRAHEFKVKRDQSDLEVKKAEYGGANDTMKKTDGEVKLAQRTKSPEVKNKKTALDQAKKDADSYKKSVTAATQKLAATKAEI